MSAEINRGVEEAKYLANGDFDTALEAAIAFGMKRGIEEERKRFVSIMKSKLAVGREGAAFHLALLGLDLSAIESILAVLPAHDASANVVDVRARRAALQVIRNRALFLEAINEQAKV